MNIIYVLAVIGALTVAVFGLLVAWVVRNALMEFWEARPRRAPSRSRLPLPLLRLWTWRRRHRAKRCPVLADAGPCPLTPRQELAWARLQKEIRS